MSFFGWAFDDNSDHTYEDLATGSLCVLRMEEECFEALLRCSWANSHQTLIQEYMSARNQRFRLEEEVRMIRWTGKRLAF